MMKIKIIEAGNNLYHQKDHCDHCGRQFVNPYEDEGIQICARTEDVTLCEECYRAAGNSVY